MNTSSLSSHLCNCKVPAESVSAAKRKWRDFDPLNRVPYHLKMLIQISFCYELQYEEFLSFSSAAVLLYQGYCEIVWKWAAVILSCSCVVQSSCATCNTVWVPGGFALPWPLRRPRAWLSPWAWSWSCQLSLRVIALVDPCHFSSHWHVKSCTVGSAGRSWAPKGSIIGNRSPV